MYTISRLRRLLPIHEAKAHCDIPCGIYDPIQAKIAAQTVLKMVLRIQAMTAPGPEQTAEERKTSVNTLTRYITVKEEHAELFKNEINIIWHDYFKPEHIEKYPELHNIVWQAAKLASKNKQTVDLDAARKLVEASDKFSEIFWDSKGTKYNDSVAEVRFGA